jgi:hypothetical protein
VNGVTLLKLLTFNCWKKERAHGVELGESERLWWGRLIPPHCCYDITDTRMWGLVLVVMSLTVSSNEICEIWSLHGGVYKLCGLLGCVAVLFGIISEEPDISFFRAGDGHCKFHT